MVQLSSKQLNKEISVGAAIDYGKIIYGTNKKLRFIKGIYTGSTVLRTYLMSKFNKPFKKKILTSESAYMKLDNKRKKDLSFLKSVKMKGFKDRTRIYSYKQ